MTPLETIRHHAGNDALWTPAEQCITEVVEELQLEHTVGLGEAAFYGPKLDFMALDALGRSWQLGTIQVDFSLPERFALEYTGADSARHRHVMIHRAIFGSIERFLAVITEDFAGDFPTWLAPQQIRILPISDEQRAYAEALCANFKEAGLRAAVDRHHDKIGGKIRRGQVDKVPYLLIVGKREIEQGQVSVRSRLQGDEGTCLAADFLTRMIAEVKTRQLPQLPSKP